MPPVSWGVTPTSENVKREADLQRLEENKWLCWFIHNFPISRADTPLPFVAGDVDPKLTKVSRTKPSLCCRCGFLLRRNWCSQSGACSAWRSHYLRKWPRHRRRWVYRMLCAARSRPLESLPCWFLSWRWEKIWPWWWRVVLEAAFKATCKLSETCILRVHGSGAQRELSLFYRRARKASRGP